MNLKRCPCGQIPGKVLIRDAGQGGKWAIVSGDCCGEWDIEFRAEYNDLASDESEVLAIEAWNDAPRDICGEEELFLVDWFISMLRKRGKVGVSFRRWLHWD